MEFKEKREPTGAEIEDQLDQLAWVIMRMYLIEHPLPTDIGTLPLLRTPRNEKGLDQRMEK